MFDAKRYGPWAIVAGASEGVGSAFAEQLADAGINLVLIARNAALLEQVADTVRPRVEVRTLTLDLTAPDMLDRVRETTRGLEIGLIVYNAGASHGAGRFLEASLEVSLNLVRLNPIGQVSLCHHFGREMVARGRGGIILVGSLAGNAGAATVVPYSASKAFTQVFAEGLWSEIQPLGVDVLYAVLGATHTPARARLGFQDKPGAIVADPHDVARECLDRIADGPVLVPAHLEESFARFCSLPRREATRAMTDLILSSKERD